MDTSTPSLRAFDDLARARRQQRGTPIPLLALDQIAPMAGQPRQTFDEETLNELAESIKTHGVIQPIIVIARKGVADTERLRYTIVCGERRFQAARLLGMASIPALVREYDDDEVAVVALLENLQREDLTPLEEGEYLAQLKTKYGFTEEQLGERLGKSRDYVHGRTRLLNLSPDILAAWREPGNARAFKTLTPSHAILVNQLDDVALRLELTRCVVDDAITVAETRRRIEMVKQLDAESGELPLEQVAKLQLASVRGMPAAEYLMRLNGLKKRGAPGAPAGPEPRLALQDLAVFRLIEELIRAGDREVGYQALSAALKADAGWMRRIKRDGLG